VFEVQSEPMGLAVHGVGWHEDETVKLKIFGILFVMSIRIAHPQILPPESHPEFEVASVRPAPKDAPVAVMSGDIGHGQVTLNNATLR
jgi:hypothetical protein